MKRKELLRAAKFTLFSASAGLIELGAFALLNFLTEFLYQRFFVFGRSIDTKR